VTMKKIGLFILLAFSLSNQTEAQRISFGRRGTSIIKAEYRDVGPHVNTLNVALLGNYNSLDIRPTGQLLANYNSTNGKWEANALIGLPAKYDPAKDILNTGDQFLLPQTPYKTTRHNEIGGVYNFFTKTKVAHRLMYAGLTYKVWYYLYARRIIFMAEPTTSRFWGARAGFGNSQFLQLTNGSAVDPKMASDPNYGFLSSGESVYFNANYAYSYVGLQYHKNYELRVKSWYNLTHAGSFLMGADLIYPLARKYSMTGYPGLDYYSALASTDNSYRSSIGYRVFYEKRPGRLPGVVFKFEGGKMPGAPQSGIPGEVDLGGFYGKIGIGFGLGFLGTVSSELSDEGSGGSQRRGSYYGRGNDSKYKKYKNRTRRGVRRMWRDRGM
jgi:hypothetical protein